MEKQQDLSGPFKLNGGFDTQLIHKEWPETNIRTGEAKKRRGNFDIVILNPDDVKKCNKSDFEKGYIKPTFVIEIGLNYRYEHFRDDFEKLENSFCKPGYIIHFERKNRKRNKDDKDRRLIESNVNKGINITSVYIYQDEIWELVGAKFKKR